MGTPFSPASAASFAERIFASAGPATAAEEAEAVRQVSADPATAAFAEAGYDLIPLARRRVALLRAASAVVPEVEVEAAGHVTAARVSAAELWRFLLPVCQVVPACSTEEGRRFVLGLAGPGASGKSILAAVLQKLLALCSADPVSAAILPMDGFHFPNAYLDAHMTDGPGGEAVPLRRLKGAPQTYDAAAFVRCVTAAATASELTVPRYDRRLHDPVPDDLRIGPGDRIVIVEGNYLLLDRPPWASVRQALDLALYLDLPAEAVREAMIARHIRGGRSPDDAAAHFERVDRPNYEICAASGHRADLILRRDASQVIVAVEAPI
jgi:pantothenate kinase